MKVLLIGAHGRTGRHIARRLRDASLPFRVLLRESSHRAEFTALGADIAIGNLTEDFSDAFTDITHVIYAAGSAESEGANEEKAIDRDAVQHTADYAKQKNVQQLIVISAISAYSPENGPSALKHYSEMKRASDDYVQKSGVPYVILRPGPLSDETARGEIAIAKQRIDDMQPVSRDDVAHVAVVCIEKKLAGTIIGFGGGNMPIEEAVLLE